MVEICYLIEALYFQAIFLSFVLHCLFLLSINIFLSNHLFFRSVPRQQHLLRQQRQMHFQFISSGLPVCLPSGCLPLSPCSELRAPCATWGNIKVQMLLMLPLLLLLLSLSQLLLQQLHVAAAAAATHRCCRCVFSVLGSPFIATLAATAH